jgi:hypothetical protein
MTSPAAKLMRDNEGGDVVWGIFDAIVEPAPTKRKKANAAPVAFRCAIRWRIRDDKPREHQAFLDTGIIERGIREAGISN